MAQVSKETISKLEALNDWLSAVFGSGTRLSHLMIQAGLSESDITKIKDNHLIQYLDVILSHIQSITDGHDGDRRNNVMVRHFGLFDGHKETLQSIADGVGLSRERIRQIVDKRLMYHRHPTRKKKFIAQLGQIAQSLLDT